ncbi:unnamed protein product [Spodoptera littoralis]|uniref:N-acetyltransferase domain-containing protein n=1 Tax=Spodoptera littoralis TaxID=7109 RepID=A0A9P0N7L9_SPOLI|nr:unnamed protein product [Spodoptera littoralis]CAH1645394.1 unnamed protein product [Spodoptera littoralis]
MSQPLKMWSKFSVTRKDGSVLKLRIMDMPRDPSVLEKVLNINLKYFVPEESTLKAARVAESAEAVEEITEFIINMLNMENHHIVVCCLDNDNDQINEIIGSSIMALTRKDDPKPEGGFKSKELMKVTEIMDATSKMYDEVKVFNLDPWFSDRGLVVCPEYRGLGIGQEFLRVRRLICKEYGIPINGAWMTSYGTQKAAERDGWETVCELRYEDLEKKFNVTYGRHPPSTKFMIARIPL